MQEEYINISIYCSSHQVEVSFIEALAEEGLIEITNYRETRCISHSQLEELEKYTRWYDELGVNPAGMDVIQHLLRRIRIMQDEMLALRNRLQMYE